VADAALQNILAAICALILPVWKQCAAPKDPQNGSVKLSVVPPVSNSLSKLGG
jgi:hypothetical protein